MGIIHSKNYSIRKKFIQKKFIQKIWKLFILKNHSFFEKNDYRPGLGETKKNSTTYNIQIYSSYSALIFSEMYSRSEIILFIFSIFEPNLLTGILWRHAPPLPFPPPHNHCHGKDWSGLKMESASLNVEKTLLGVLDWRHLLVLGPVEQMSEWEAESCKEQRVLLTSCPAKAKYAELWNENPIDLELRKSEYHSIVLKLMW